MPTPAKREFEEHLALLHAAIDTLRAELLNFKKATGSARTLVDRGTDMVDALACVQGPQLRQDLADALRDFEAQRHRARLAIIALAREQGASISEVGRQLGISRQLAYRLAAEEEAG